MKKKLRTLAKIAVIALLALSANVSFGQVVFTSAPDSIAVVNQIYNYQPVFVAAPNAPTFSLMTSPAGMTINASTGLISWTPASMTVGGPVEIKAHNTSGDYYQRYFIFITNAVVCDTSIISYWPLDNKVATTYQSLPGFSFPENIHNNDAKWNNTFSPEPLVVSDAMVGSSVKLTPASSEDWALDVTDNSLYQFSGTTQFSVSFWFKNLTKTYVSTKPEVFVGRYGGPESGSNQGWHIDWNPATERIEFYMRDDGYTDTTLVNPTPIMFDDNNWHHVVATFYNGPDLAQKAFLHLFVDGVNSEAKFDFWKDGFAGTGMLTIGYDQFWVEPYTGQLDEIAIWKKELLQSDVDGLRTQGLAHQPMCKKGDVAPVISSTAVTDATQDVAYTYQLTYRTIGGSPVVLSAPVLPSWLNFNTSTGILSGTPTNDNVGDHNVTLQLTSGTITIDQTFVITVANVNDPPVITSTPSTAGAVSELYTYIITATDIDAGTVLTFSAPILPSWLTFEPTTKLLAGVPAQANKGANEVKLSVSDGIVTVNQTFVINVTGPTGVQDNTSSIARVYPVPAKEYVMFDFSDKLDKAELQIFSTTGSLLKKVEINNSTSYRLDVSDLTPNNYLYRINTSKGQQTGALIIK
jgi:hypothetical protein